MRLLNFGWAAVLASLAAAPVVAQQCRFADLGLLGYSCRNCHIREDERSGVREYRFGTELTLGRIRADGPTAGVLKEGDVLVAVDGAPITTAEGGRRFGSLAPGRGTTLTIRRDGRTREVRVVPGAKCDVGITSETPRAPGAPPAPPAPPAPRASRAPMAPPPPAPPVPPAPPAPPAPPPPPDFLPDGWFGFGIACRNCQHYVENGRSSFAFRSAPQVESVEPGTPAARAGMQRGDRLTHIDGLALTTRAAWRRFSEIRPGQRVRWTFTRNNRQQTAELLAVRRPDARPPRTTSRAATHAAEQRLRYSGAVGGAEIEVRGAPVSVTRDPRTGEIVIRSADLTVRVRPDQRP